METSWPRRPVIYEISTWVWLSELSQHYQRAITRDSVPVEQWDAIASLGMDTVWLMGVWERSPEGIRIANENVNLQADFRRALPDYIPLSDGARRMKQRVSLSTLLNTSLLAAIALASAAIGVLAVRRTSTKGLQSRSKHPTCDYDAALARLQSTDDDTINPVCRSQLLTHGHKTELAIVLIHGLTNCPQQYVQFAPLLYECGYNVLVPRLPRHGLADRFTDDLKHLSAQELRDWTDAVLDIASGLGDQVTVAGISAGGVLAAWVAQYRSDVERVILIAPALGFLHFSLPLQRLIMTLCLLLPDGISRLLGRFKDAPDHCYLGYSTHALGEVLRLGFAVLQAAKKDKPAAPSVLAITNAVDTQVNNQITALLLKRWQDRGLEHLERYEFEAKQELMHDIIEPEQRQQRTAFVYPILLDLITHEKGG